MEGTLFRYGPKPAHVAFKSGAHSRHVVIIGGLTDGLLFAKYVPVLAQRLEATGASLVQTLLTSSHQGWGMGTLQRDADELLLLLRHLKAEHASQGVVLIGHSTGTQDAVMYGRRHKGDGESAPLLGVILQAPVSDREWFTTYAAESTQQRLKEARRLVALGKGDEVAFVARDLDGAPVSGKRWLSLAGEGGDDDMFSSDLSDEDLKRELGGLEGVPTLVMLSGADEYTNPLIDYRAVGERITAAIGPTARMHVVEGGKHSLEDHVEEAADLMTEFVTSL